MRDAFRVIGLCCLVHLADVSAHGAFAQDLPVETYTTADGLPNEVLSRVVQDAHGILWIAGHGGLIRFDGEVFTAFGKSEGLDIGTGVNALHFDSHGDLWLGTNGAGIFHFDVGTPDRASPFTQMLVGAGRAVNRVNVIAFAADGAVWAGTDAGLYTGRRDQAFRRIELPLQGDQSQEMVQVFALVNDGERVWVGTAAEVFRCDGREARCARGPQINGQSLLLDKTRNLWIGGADGVHVVRAGSESLTSPPTRVTPAMDVRRLAEGSGGVWAAVGHQLMAIEGGVARTLPLAAPLPIINDIVEDPARNLWIATQRGLVVVRRQGVTVFSSRHGLTGSNLQGLRRGRTGHVFAADDGHRVYRIEGEVLLARRFVLPRDVIASSWPTTTFLIDHTGEMWLGTGSGLVRFGQVDFSGANRTREVHAKQRYTRRDGLAGDHISSIFEDSRGDLWIASTRDNPETLTVWRRASARFERLGAEHGLPPFNQPMALIEDAEGAIWSALREGGVVRIEDGRAVVYGANEGFPSLVTASHVDRLGNLWFGGTDGLAHVDRQARDVRAVPMTTGLTGRVLSLEEDPSGHIAVGTTAGLLVLDPISRNYRRLTRSDGVPDGPVDALARAADGAILMIAGRALARWMPNAETIVAPDVRCLLSGVRAAGRNVPVQPPGVEQLENIEVPAAQNAIEFEFFAVSRRLGERLTYQYRLVGLSDEWMTASQRRAAYAGLAAGRYTFEVRASGDSAAIPSTPASVTFRVLPPWYRRGWFLAASATTVLLLAAVGHRARLAAAVRTERLRSRIATDLHDDIGSSLSQIAILAEVAKRRAGDSSAAVAEPLTSIAATSRDLVEAMSDIVWAVNPQTDSLSDLTHRMRRFAEETLGAADIALTFSAPPAEADLRMGADLRRELYLILKESVNNIARHSGATAATIDFSVTRRELRLRIADNGRGFNLDDPLDGHGITSMRKRAAAFGGRLQIESRGGEGTVVSLSAKR